MMMMMMTRTMTITTMMTRTRAMAMARARARIYTDRGGAVVTTGHIRKAPRVQIPVSTKQTHFSVVSFSHQSKCWGGPPRSFTVL